LRDTRSEDAVRGGREDDAQGKKIGQKRMSRKIVEKEANPDGEDIQGRRR